MKTIKILGTGCPKCKSTEAIVRKAVEESGVEAEILKVEEIDKIMAYNIFSTPAVVIDEVVKIKGRIPDINEIKALLN
jgi:small redox-active disulfide protein 2